jgi:small subunit ribosomal protein S3
MGQKIHPTGFRLPLPKTGVRAGMQTARTSPACCRKISRFVSTLKHQLAHASVGRVLIERPAKNARVTFTRLVRVLLSARRVRISSSCATDLAAHHGRSRPCFDRRNPQAGNRCAADRRLDRSAARKAHHVPPCHEARDAECHASGCQGIKVMSAGRLNGAEIARSEWYREGRVPLHTLRADIDYATSEALTTYGIIGIKVWVIQGRHA